MFERNLRGLERASRACKQQTTCRVVEHGIMVSMTSLGRRLDRIVPWHDFGMVRFNNLGTRIIMEMTEQLQVKKTSMTK